MFKPTRKLKVNELQATDSVQSVDFAENPVKTIIDVTTSGSIRVQIDGEPGTLDGSNGIFVSYEKPLVLYDHYVNNIKFIRDLGMTGNVNFQIIGFY